MAVKNTPLSPEVLDFSPGLLSIQESPPARLPRAVMYAVAALFAILLAWAVFGKLEIIASADATTIANDLATRSLQLRRIDAELAGKALTRKRDDPVELFNRVEAQQRDHRKSYEDAREQAQQALNRAEHEYDSAQEVLIKLQQTLPILKQQADSYTEMGRDGYIPQMTVLDKQRDYLEKSQDLRAQQATVASLEASVNQARKQLAQVTSKYRSDLQNEKMEVGGQHSKLKQDWVKQEHRSGLLELRVPEAGIVKNIATHTLGTVVSPGTVLFSIVPEHEPLAAEIMIKNEDVGFVHTDQKVRIKLAAYPFVKYGMLDGSVTRIQADSESGQGTNDQTGRKQALLLAYKAIISLSSQILEAEDQKLKLVPGMQVVAEINQGSRTVMDYLLSPVSKTLHESGHER